MPSSSNSLWRGRGPRLSVSQLQEQVGATLTTHAFKISLSELEAYRGVVLDYLAYPPEENPEYPAEQVNLCYLLAIVDTLRVQLFVDDAKYMTITAAVGEARITSPIYTSDELVMECSIDKVTEVRGKYWCMFSYRFIKTGETEPCAVSKQTVCLVPR